MKELNKLFYNPPKGGNEHGVQTQSSMAPGVQPIAPPPPVEFDRTAGLRYPRVPPYPGQGDQPELRGYFNQGRYGAAISAQQSHQAGPADLRNYERGMQPPPEGPGDPRYEMMYDYERDQVGRRHQAGISPPSQGNGQIAARPLVHPDTSMPYRSDGKAIQPMGVPANGNPGVQSNTDSNGGRADGQNRDNPAHELGRNKVLTEKARSHIKGKNFAMPGERKYPIPDKKHAAAALGFAKMHHAGTAEEAKVKAAVHRKYPDMGK